MINFTKLNSFNARLLVLEAQSLAEWEKCLGQLSQAPLHIPRFQWANESIYLYFFELPKAGINHHIWANSMWVAREYVGMEHSAENNLMLGGKICSPFSYDLFPGELFSFSIDQWKLPRASALNPEILGQLAIDSLAKLQSQKINVASTWRVAWHWGVPFGVCDLEFFQA